MKTTHTQFAADPSPASKALRAIKAMQCHDELVTALSNMITRYTGLVNCGDCGNWDPEREEIVIRARAALAKAGAA